MFVIFLLLTLALAPQVCSAQTFEKPGSTHGSRFAVGIKMSLLGAGVETATPLTTHFNLRAGFNIFDYSGKFHSDGLTYTANLNLRSIQLNFDWFPFHNGFHVSPGLLVYNGNRAYANLSVPSGQLFHLDHNTFRSDPQDPIRGSASVKFRKLAPALLLGWGNLLGRRPHHFSVPFEFGVVFHGQPDFALNLTGSGCDAQNIGCEPIDADSEGKKDILQERARIARTVSTFEYYPVVSVGLAYGF